MEFKNLHGLAEALARSILENKNVESTVFQLSRVLSYLESEQHERVKLAEAMKELREELYGGEDKPGLSHLVASMNAQSKRNGKFLYGITAGVVLAVVLQLLKLKNVL